MSLARGRRGIQGYRDARYVDLRVELAIDHLALVLVEVVLLVCHQHRVRATVLGRHRLVLLDRRVTIDAFSDQTTQLFHTLSVQS